MASVEVSTQERQLCDFLRDLPKQKKYRYDESAINELLFSLFWSLGGGDIEHMRLLFPEKHWPDRSKKTLLKEAQGAEEGAEYTEAARGKACGHIFKSGEATYRCKTCTNDDTCVLCSRCYASSDHTDHVIMISISSGNSGCCDCGDPEAWNIPVHCTIHTDHETLGTAGIAGKGKAKDERQPLPAELQTSIRMTVSRVLDFMCDVFSCSPEHLRLAKTKARVLRDEQTSRFNSRYYSDDAGEEPVEFAVILWNDEKHTVVEVRDQVARACKIKLSEAMEKAYETDEIGRSIVMYGTNVDQLLKVAATVEQIKVTVSVRSSRDTFREQMCETLIEWLNDISGCMVGSDGDILRQVVCEEMLKAWQRGSGAANAEIGKNGIDDHENTDWETDPDEIFLRRARLFQRQAAVAANAVFDRRPLEAGNDGANDADDAESEDSGEWVIDEMDVSDDMDDILDVILVRPHGGAQTQDDQEESAPQNDIDMDDSPAQEAHEATLAGFPPPPPPPPPPPQQDQNNMVLDDQSLIGLEDSETVRASAYPNRLNMDIPLTPGNKAPRKPPKHAPAYWVATPKAFQPSEVVPLHENLFERLRLDWLILFDLRLWKRARINLRDLFISTVVSIPQFKRVLGLRFAGLYTLLAQLYLIADREPDHSIIMLSVQMLTTQSITAEVVEKGNFLTHLFAILFTFLASRQVAAPFEVNPNSTLKIETGSVTNRRMYHFFLDLKYLFNSPAVQERFKTEERYLMQFLDLVKLHQGICPNTRAVGDHVEYETDAWISASLVTREINRLCRHLSESFQCKPGDDLSFLARAIHFTAKVVIINSVGAERERFKGCEVKSEMQFKKVGDYEFDTSENGEHTIVKFDLMKEPVSFHHALHFTLSWLIECGKSMSKHELVNILRFDSETLFQKPRLMGIRNPLKRKLTPNECLLAIFDYPLRVCAWLAHMRAGLWVRNGMSLRHQASTYRSVSQRDVSYNRDIFLLQTAMVVCPPETVLASIIDRYGLEMWMKGIYEQNGNVLDHSQQLDVAEDLIHLLIILLCERSLVVPQENQSRHISGMKRDIIHALCFKPLSFTELCQKLPDKFSEQDECQDLLGEMTNFRPPVGISDAGTFQLKEEYLQELDPYIAHFNKNAREEAENVYRKAASKKSGRPLDEVVFEPVLPAITSGLFTDLTDFVNTGIFAQIIYYSILYCLKSQSLTPSVPATKVEAFLQVALHLVLVAASCDSTAESDANDECLKSFVYVSLTQPARSNFMQDAPQAKTIVALLDLLLSKQAFEPCHAKIKLILKRFRKKRPRAFDLTYARMGASIDRIGTASPATLNPDSERERKRKAALERQAKIKAEYQQKQATFLSQQNEEFDWGVDDDDDEMMDEDTESKNMWKYPSDNCLFCQEETNDSRAYGTFGMISESRILRQTVFEDKDFVREVASLPENLDRDAESLRPFGVSGENKRQIRKLAANGTEVIEEQYFIGKGYPASATIPGPVSTGCGHIMHYTCFDAYCQSTHRTQRAQIARHHPERLDKNEFICPLCKAQNNAFLPIVWRDKEESYPGIIGSSASGYAEWLTKDLAEALYNLDLEIGNTNSLNNSQTLHKAYDRLVQPLRTQVEEVMKGAWEDILSSQEQVVADPTDTQSLDGRAAPTLGLAQVAPPNDPFQMQPQPSVATPAAVRDSNFVQLLKILGRLITTFQRNGFTNYSNPGETASGKGGLDMMANTLGMSIAAVEIQQRGVDCEGCTSFVGKIPELSLTHLRILSETAATAMAFLTQSGKRGTEPTLFAIYCIKQRFQMFGAYSFTEKAMVEPLFSRDIFCWFVEASLGLATFIELDVMHLARLCYMAEISKVLMLVVRNMPLSMLASDGPTPFKGALEYIARIVQMQDQNNSGVDKTPRGLDQSQFSTFEAIEEFVKRYALVFLRKLTLLLYVRDGVDFNAFSPHNSTELERLTQALRFPSFQEICGAIAGTAIETGRVRPQVLILDWVKTAIEWELECLNQRGVSEDAGVKITVSHPVIFEPVGLPKNYDTLVAAATKTRCPTTGKDVSDPTLCLFCGEIFCAQASCCLKEEPREVGQFPARIGGAQQHMRRCNNPIGLFINIRKCNLYYLHRKSGSWGPAPYTDKYGETDQGLRHGRQLFLNQKRYDALVRNVWLGHGVPSVISRKLETGEANNGGWETI